MPKKKIKIVFVPMSYNMHLSYHHGVGILSAVAKKAGAEVKIYQIHDEIHPPVAAKCAREISSLRPDFICISTSTLEWEFAKNLARELKKISKAKIIVGGPHSTFCPGDDFGLFDSAVIGEGEEVVKNLAQGNFPEKKLVYGELVGDLDGLPYSDRDSFEMEKIISARQGIVDFITQRGCPYNCSYCSNHALRKIYGIEYIRRRSVENVIEEIKNVVQQYKNLIRMVFFHDDNFILSEDWVKNFCRRYEKEIALPWMVNSSVNHLSDEIIKILAKADCQEVRIGVESGDEKLRQKVLNKLISNKIIKERFEAVKKSGMRVYAFMMHGIPGDTEDSYRRGVELLAEIKPNVIRSSVFFPLPSTVLGDPFWENFEMPEDASYIGDSPSSPLEGRKALSRFYMFGWRINNLLGLKDYGDLIKKYEEVTDRPEELRRRDREMSKKMLRQKKVHYRFGRECSMLKLEDGKKLLLK